MDRIKIKINRTLTQQELQAFNTSQRIKRNRDIRFSIYGGSMYIDVNIPKFLFRNTFKEVEDNHLPDFIKNCKAEASKIGITLTDYDIKGAHVCYWEFCKNILLPEKYNLEHFLNRIYSSCLGKNTDKCKTEYFNANNRTGVKVGFRTNQYESCFYDKTGEVLQSRRQIDKDIYIEVKKQGNKVVRFEYRVSTAKQAQKIALKYKCCCTLEGFWNRYLEKELLLDIWQEIESNLSAPRQHSKTLKYKIIDSLKAGTLPRDIVFGVGLLEIDRILGTKMFFRLIRTYAKCCQKTNKITFLKNNLAKFKSSIKRKKQYPLSYILRQLTAFQALDFVNGQIIGGDF